MATGQTLLDTMELLNQELQLQSGESDVTRGLVALNRAQDYFESMAATRRILGSSGQEYTTFPSGVLRIDRLQILNSSNQPEIELTKLNRVGGHAVTREWPLNLLTSSTSGKPSAYWTNGTNIYWTPTPDGVYTVRWYGFQVASDISAGGTFAYPDIVILPIASFATQLMKMGVDDPAQDASGLATASFKAVLDSLSAFNRDGAVGFEYTMVHDT
jgi:hypothetical protein